MTASAHEQQRDPAAGLGALASARNVASLISAVTIFQLAGGLLGVHIPLAARADEISRAGVGLIGAAFAAGFMLGAWYGPRFLARVGHIRVFAAAGAVAAVATLALHGADSLTAWCVLRLLAGAAVAMLFSSAESWMNGAVGLRERGNVLGFYHVCTKLALAAGPFLILGAAASAPEPLMTACAFFALSILPICFTSRAQPEPPKAQPLALGGLFDLAPAAVIGCLGAGMINGAVLAFSPLYAERVLGEGAAPAFQAAAWGGSLLLQWPAGRLSDRVDRRTVVAGLSGFAALSGLALAVMGDAPSFLLAGALFALWGAGGLSYYGVAVAHMADRAEPGQIARATSGLLFVWAFGSILGPALLGWIVDLTDALPAIFWFAAAANLLVALAMFWRRASRPAPQEKEPFANKTATSVSAAELTYGEPAAEP